MSTIKTALAGTSAWMDDNTLLSGTLAFCLGFAITWALL